jgi:hypothetical protein
LIRSGWKARPFQKDINETLDELLLEALLDDLDPLETLQRAQDLAQSSLNRFKSITDGENQNDN